MFVPTGEVRLRRCAAWIVAAGLTLGVWGCSEDSGTPAAAEDASDGAADASGEDSGEDAAPDAPEPEPEPAFCTQALRWEAGRPLGGQARDHHATFISDRDGVARLHVIGGTDYSDVLKDHWAAAIQEDGSLGAWSEEAPLPEGAAGQGLAQVDGEVYLIGGQGSGFFKPEVYRARWGAGGAITGWDEEAPVPEGHFHTAAAAWGRHVYASGGVNTDGDAQATLYHGEVDAEGHLARWDTWALPGPRSHHATFVQGDGLFLVLGFEGNPFQNATTPHRDVLRASIQPDGTLGAWEDVGFVPRRLAALAAIPLGDCAFVLGGLLETSDGFSYSDEVLRLYLEEPTAIGYETMADGLKVGRSHMHHAAYHRGRLYIVGGSQDYQDVTQEVEIGTFGAP